MQDGPVVAGGAPPVEEPLSATPPFGSKGAPSQRCGGSVCGADQQVYGSTELLPIGTSVSQHRSAPEYGASQRRTPVSRTRQPTGGAGFPPWFWQAVMPRAAVIVSRIFFIVFQATPLGRGSNLPVWRRTSTPLLFNFGTLGRGGGGSSYTNKKKDPTARKRWGLMNQERR